MPRFQSSARLLSALLVLGLLQTGCGNDDNSAVPVLNATAPLQSVTPGENGNQTPAPGTAGSNNPAVAPLTNAFQPTTAPLSLVLPDNAEFGYSSLSADGQRIALDVELDDSNRPIFEERHTTLVLDRTTGSAQLTDPGYGSAATARPAISGDGRWTAFEIWPSVRDGVSDVYVRAFSGADNEKISGSSNGGQANGNSGLPSLPQDGRLVAFESYASNLVSGDTNGQPDIFLRDRQSGTTQLVSTPSSGTAQAMPSLEPNMSADGRFVAFSSRASNLAPGDTNGNQWDIFVFDRQTGLTELASAQQVLSSYPGDGGYAPSISADGRYVAFESRVIRAGVSERQDHIPCLFDRATNTFTQLRLINDLSDVFATSGDHLHISGDGRFVVFSDNTHLFVYDQSTRSTQTLATSNAGDTGVLRADAISQNGRVISYTRAVRGRGVVETINNPLLP